MSQYALGVIARTFARLINERPVRRNRAALPIRKSAVMNMTVN